MRSSGAPGSRRQTEERSLQPFHAWSTQQWVNINVNVPMSMGAGAALGDALNADLMDHDHAERCARGIRARSPRLLRAGTWWSSGSRTKPLTS